MTLTTGALTHSGWAALVPLLQALGWNSADSDQVEHWYQHPGKQAEGNTLLIHSRAERILALSLQQGQSPEQAVGQWQQQAEALLAYFKANRRTTRVIDACSLQNNPAALSALCESLGADMPERVPAIEKTEEPQAHYLLIAMQLVRQNPVVETLMAQLEACTLPLDENSLLAPEPDLSAVIANLNKHQQTRKELQAQRRENEQLNSKLQELEQKNQAVHEELLHSQAELASAHSNIEELKQQRQTQHEKAQVAEQQLADTEARLAELNAQHSEQTNALAQHQQENQLLLEQLHLVQEELEQQLLRQNEQAQAHEERTQAQQADIERLTGELATKEKQVTTEQARSKQQQAELAKANADLSAVRTKLQAAEQHAQTTDKKLSTTEQQLADTQAQLAQVSTQHSEQTNALAQHQQENQLLLEQLHLVQEELEKQFLKHQKLEQQLARYTEEQDHALAAANKQINRLQDELNRIKSSTAWKAAAPVRALGRPFKRTPADKRKLQKQARQLESSEYFDREWYRNTYPDVAENAVEPAEHYLKFGADEGRNPSERFDTLWYLQANPDVKDAGLNPLVHFLDHGQAEGRAPNPHEQISLPSPTEVK